MVDKFMSYVKKEIQYIRDSFSQILKAFIVFILFSSGLFVALLLRSIGTNGTIISSVSIISEIIALIMCYFLLKKYIVAPEEKEMNKGKTK
jgi:uncharacterized protein YacL